MSYADHDHRGEYAEDRHDHDGDYAEKYHRHYDLETDDKTAQRAITCLREEVDELRRQLAGAIAQLRVLDRLRPTCVICHDAAADRQTVRGPACTDCVGDRPDDGPDPDRPETWAFAEAQEDQADEPKHGPAAMRRFMREHPLSPDDYVQRFTGCAGTSDGEHAGDWCDGGRCGACGLLGPQPDDEAEAVRKCNACPAPATCSEFGRCPLEAEPEPEPYDPGPEIDDEGGVSGYRYTLPEDCQRGQS